MKRILTLLFVLSVELAFATQPHSVNLRHSSVYSTAERTIRTKLDEAVSVKDFGAKGDGVTDDTSAFIAALATCSTIFIPDGNYKGNGTIITLASSTSILGQSAERSIITDIGFKFSGADSSGSVVEKVYLKANAVATLTALEFSYSPRYIVKDVRILGHNKGIVSGYCFVCSLQDIYIYGTASTGVEIDSATNTAPVAVFDLNNVWVTGCGLACKFENLYNLNCDSCTFENSLDNVDVDMRGCSYGSFINCYFEHTATQSAIAIKGNTSLTGVTAQDKMTIMNCSFRGHWRGIDSRFTRSSFIANEIIVASASIVFGSNCDSITLLSNQFVPAVDTSNVLGLLNFDGTNILLSENSNTVIGKEQVNSGVGSNMTLHAGIATGSEGGNLYLGSGRANGTTASSGSILFGVSNSTSTDGLAVIGGVLNGVKEWCLGGEVTTTGYALTVVGKQLASEVQAIFRAEDGTVGTSSIVVLATYTLEFKNGLLVSVTP